MESARIGVDESGKGDYFGYLVIAGVLLESKKEDILKSMGVKDSKLLSDMAVHKIASMIKKECKYDIVKISPEKYNQLYGKFKSLNKLLAWGHARVIKNLLEKSSCDLAISDKFGDESLIKDQLKGIAIELVQKIHAEADTAVAAASILARDEFLITLRKLGRDVGIVIPKGSTHVKAAAEELLKKYDKNILSMVAKLHFKITKQLLKN